MSSLILENEELRVSVNRRAGFIDVIDKAPKVSWNHYSNGEPTGIVQLREAGRQETRCPLSASKNIEVSKADKSSVRITFEDLVCEEGVAIGGGIDVKISLEDCSLKFVIENVRIPDGFVLEKLYYPFKSFYLEKNDDGYIVWPQGNGVIIPARLGTVKEKLHESGLLPRDLRSGPFKIAITTEYPVYRCWAFSMPWFGTARGNSAYIAIVDTPDDASAYITILDLRNKERLVFSPIWEPSMGELRYPRSVTYTFIGYGNYVSMAKTYRKYVMEKGLYRSLKEKIKDNPNVERVIGAPIVKLWIMNRYPWTGCIKETARGKLPLISVVTSYEQVQTILMDMYHNLGIDRALILLAGWGPIGYDNVHPDIWPPGRWPGEFKELKEARDIADSQGYLFGLHDNYQDIYFESPSIGVGESILKGKDVRGAGHTLVLGGIWQGGQAFIICSKWGLRYAQRNMPQIMEDLKPTCYFVDTTTAAPLYECYDAEHPTTRSEDKKYKIKLLDYLNDLKLVTGSETGVYWATPCAHFGEGIMMLESSLYGGIPVPLFNLVYHDSVVSYWHQGWGLNRGQIGLMRTKFLLDLLYGNPTSWNFDGKSYEEFKEKLKLIFKDASALHRKVALDEMVNHRFLTDDYLVHETEFSSGVKVIANFSSKEYITEEDKAVKPMDYIIKPVNWGQNTFSNKPSMPL